MIGNFPRSFQDLNDWAEVSQVTLEEARQRLAQFVVLRGIASAPLLRQCLVFKGGNALDFIWQPNRSTLDLDFSLDMDASRFDVSADSIERLLGLGLGVSAGRVGMAIAIYSVRQEPPGDQRMFAAYRVRVGFAFPDEPRLLLRMANNHTSPHALSIEISLNEPVCESIDIVIDTAFQPLRVSSLADIVGEKLRSLLQQPIRNRNRRQDLLDIAVIVQAHPGLDRRQIAEILLAKSAARNVSVSKAAFGNPAVAERARVDYDALEITTRTVFIGFDEALATVLRFVDELPIATE